MRKTLKIIIPILLTLVLVFAVTIITFKDIEKDLIIHFLDVGQADSILVELPEKKTMLIDAGNNSDGNMIVQYLKERNIDTIDFLIGTHPHEDHIGGLDDLIDNFKIGKIYLPKVTHTTKTFEDVLLAIQRKGKKIRAAKAGVNIIYENELKVYFLGPQERTYDELNHYSAVIKLDYLNNSFLFTGDAEIINEKEMLREYGSQLRADILKTGHHGSNSSTSQEFLAAVTPAYAVISVGKDNPYGHPSPEVIKRLNKANIKIFRTDLQGTIIVQSNGTKISFDLEKNDLE